MIVASAFFRLARFVRLLGFNASARCFATRRNPTPGLVKQFARSSESLSASS